MISQFSNISELSEMTNVDRKTAAKRVQMLSFVEGPGGARLYSTRAALHCIALGCDNQSGRQVLQPHHKQAILSIVLLDHMHLIRASKHKAEIDQLVDQSLKEYARLSDYFNI